MQLTVSNSTSNLTQQNLPSVPSYKELLEARKKRLEERTKSAGALQLLKILEPSTSASKLPQMNQKFQQPAIIKKLNYDFGSLKEFLNYDLKLKRPEDMFKMDKNRRIEVKNKEEDLRKGLMQHVRQEIDTRSAKTILIEEKDPEKVSKAAKRFVSDMVSEIFQEDLHLLERKMHQKGVSKLYELLVGLDGDDPVRKVAEKYGYKTLPDKFKILEAEIEKRRILSESQALNAKKGSKGFGFQSKMSIYGMSPGLQEDSLMQSPLEIGSHGSYKRTSHRTPVPVLAHHPEVYMSRQSSIDMGKNQLKKPHMFIEESGVAYVARKDARSMSPKLKQKKDTDEERMAYVIKFIKSSATLEQVYAEYDRAEKEQFNKELKQAEENAKASYRDYYGLKSDERVSAVTKNHIVFTHSELKPNFVMHTMFQFQTFSSLWILNLRGCDLQENILWLMLKVIERYSPDIRMIDISENEASERVCEVVKDILKKTELKVLRMANMGLKSKGLAIVCLGLAESPAVTELDFNYNDIDEYGFKTLALILRHCRTLQTVKILRKKKVIVNFATGEEKLEEEELGYQAMAALTKAFKHNKYINPKNVLLFEAKSAY